MKEEIVQELTEILLAVEMRILATVDARLLSIERDISTIKLTVLDIHEDLDASLRATDNHAEQLIDHTKRIRRLEKRAA